MELTMGAAREQKAHAAYGMSRWMQSDTFFSRDSKVSRTNVCNPAVRLKSMTFFRCWWLLWISCCNLFCFRDDGKRKQVTAPFPPPIFFFLSFCLLPPSYVTSSPSGVFFPLFWVFLRFLHLEDSLLVTGRRYKIQFLGPIKETHEYFFFCTWHFK